jgi:hypothetical protein
MNPKIVLWTGGNAPNREAQLTVKPQYSNDFAAYWEPGYCGCPDCHPIVGYGQTKEDAIADYWERWEESQC